MSSDCPTGTIQLPLSKENIKQGWQFKCVVDMNSLRKTKRGERKARRTRTQGGPKNDPRPLKDRTVRRGTNRYWWQTEAGEWAPLGTHTTPTGFKKAPPHRPLGPGTLNWAQKTGRIMVHYNTPDRCDALKASCALPTVPSRDGWEFVEDFPPYSPEETYVHNEEYSGPLDFMKAFQSRLEAQFRAYKQKGTIKSYKIVGQSMKDHLLKRA